MRTGLDRPAAFLLFLIVSIVALALLYLAGLGIPEDLCLRCGLIF